LLKVISFGKGMASRAPFGFVGTARGAHTIEKIHGKNILAIAIALQA
jgi:hypothetical protein